MHEGCGAERVGDRTKMTGSSVSFALLEKAKMEGGGLKHRLPVNGCRGSGCT